MKKIATLFSIAFAFVAMSVSAQQYKFAQINSQELVMLMSEMDSARVKLQAYQMELTETMEAMQTEYNTLLNEYQQKQATWGQAKRESKEQQIQDIVRRLEEFNVSAQNEMQQMQQVYMGPVYQKAQEAITKVAKENGFTYVFDISAGPLLYFDEAVTTNLLPLAKAELGIPAEKVAPTQLPVEGQAE